MTEKIIAKSLSVLFHPIVYPTYGFLLLYFLDSEFVVQTNSQAKLYILGIVFINTFLIPGTLLFLFKKRGMISSLNIEKREERFYPFIYNFVVLCSDLVFNWSAPLAPHVYLHSSDSNYTAHTRNGDKPILQD